MKWSKFIWTIKSPCLLLGTCTVLPPWGLRCFTSEGMLRRSSEYNNPDMSLREVVSKDKEIERKRERWWQTETQTGGSALLFTAGFSSPIHPCLIFFTSHLPFSAATVSHTAGGNYTTAHRGAGQSITRTRLRMRACALARCPTTLKQKQAFFNCYMGESDVSFSFYHIVMCIIITLGRKFNALLMACMEKNKSINHKLQWSNCCLLLESFSSTSVLL